MFGSIVGIVVVGVALWFFVAIATEFENRFIGFLAGVFGAVAMLATIPSILLALLYIANLLLGAERSADITLQYLFSVAPWAIAGWAGLIFIGKSNRES